MSPNLVTEDSFNLKVARSALEDVIRKHQVAYCVVTSAQARVQTAERDIEAALCTEYQARMGLDASLKNLPLFQARLESAREDLAVAQQLPNLSTSFVRRVCAVSDLALLPSYVPPIVPVTTLPAELVLDIFDLAQSYLEPRDVSWNRSMVLSQVNRRWRCMALGVPALWSTIDYRFGAQCAHLFARRAQSHPLHISITYLGGPVLSLHSSYADPGFEDWSQHLYTFLLAVLPHAPRWTSLTLSNIHNFRTVLEWISDGFKDRGFKSIILDKVLVRNTRYTVTMDDISPYREIDGLLFLARRVVLDHCCNLAFNLFSTEVTYLELRDFQMYTYQPQSLDIFEILRYCPNLRELLLYLNLDMDSPKTVELPRLHRLTLRMSGPRVSCLLRHLKSPNLAHVELQVVADSPEDALHACRFLSSDLPLVELTLSRVFGSYGQSCNSVPHWPGPARSALNDTRLCPLLEILELRGTHIDDNALMDLVELSRLRYLRLNLEPFVTIDGLKRMLIARVRCNALTTIQRLEVLWCERLKESDQTQVRNLVSEQLWWADDSDSDHEWNSTSSLEHESDEEENSAEDRELNGSGIVQETDSDSEFWDEEDNDYGYEDDYYDYESGYDYDESSNNDECSDDDDDDEEEEEEEEEEDEDDDEDEDEDDGEDEDEEDDEDDDDDSNSNDNDDGNDSYDGGESGSYVSSGDHSQDT